jgi:hypothetical protein
LEREKGNDGIGPVKISKEDFGGKLEGGREMKRRVSPLLISLCTGIFFLSCSASHRVIVVYDRADGLKTGDRVYWESQVIGRVGTLEKDPKAGTDVPLEINQDFSHRVTDQSRFLIQRDPVRAGHQAVEMVQLAPGGQPLPNGAVVEGSTSFSFMVEKGSREIQGWSRLFQDNMDRLEKEMKRLSEQEWQKELERQMKEWTRELERSSAEARRYFKKEILPQLEEAVQDLLGRLKELEREKEGHPLERELDHLQRTLGSRDRGQNSSLHPLFEG